MLQKDYVTRVISSPSQVHATEWNALLCADGATPQPFMRHEYLAAMHDSGSATSRTGWTPQWITLWEGTRLAAACALYLKAHSYGEYVFDWAWANAYQQHGLAYYPKALVAPPFTPVPGPRLLACDAQARRALVKGLLEWCASQGLSSLHLLFLSDEDIAACQENALMLRHTVQFHWHNRRAAPAPQADQTPDAGPAPFVDFDDFLGSLSQEKRKKIRQERRKVAEAGVQFRWAQGADISAADWAFFYRCYERTYLEHGNAPYLTPAFFQQVAAQLPEHWLMFTAERGGQPIASSLIGLRPPKGGQAPGVAYGRYWGALERVDCLHFEACYYQPLAWCIAQGYGRFEGGAQGEHKMARALMPVRTTSAHWLAHPAFADAVERFLDREAQGVGQYMEHLAERTPFRRDG